MRFCCRACFSSLALASGKETRENLQQETASPWSTLLRLLRSVSTIFRTCWSLSQLLIAEEEERMTALVVAFGGSCQSNGSLFVQTNNKANMKNGPFEGVVEVGEPCLLELLLDRSQKVENERSSGCQGPKLAGGNAKARRKTKKTSRSTCLSNACRKNANWLVAHEHQFFWPCACF
jgi:hypothetical protein